MKRLKTTLLLVIIAVTCAILITACTKQDNADSNTETPNALPTPSPAEYTADVRLDTDGKTILGNMHIAYDAPSDHCKRIVLWTACKVTKATTADGDAPVTGNKAYTAIELPKDYAYCERIDIDMQLEYACESLKKEIFAHDYLPLICAYQEDYLTPAPCDYADYREIGEGNVQVTLRAPKSVTLTTNGKLIDKTFEEEAQVLTIRYAAGESMDAAASAFYTKTVDVIGNTSWEYYATTKDALTHQTIVGIAQNAYDLWGDCASTRISLVQRDEYAYVKGMITMGNLSIEALTRAIVSQWVGPRNQRWIAESLQEEALWAYYRAYDPQKAKEMRDNAKQNVVSYGVLLGETGENARMDRTPTRYDEYGYKAMVIDKGLLFWTNLHEIGGDGVGKAVQAMRLRPTMETADLIAILKENTHADYTYYVDAWVQGKVLII